LLLFHFINYSPIFAANSQAGDAKTVFDIFPRNLCNDHDPPGGYAIIIIRKQTLLALSRPVKPAVTQNNSIFIRYTPFRHAEKPVIIIKNPARDANNCRASGKKTVLPSWDKKMNK
jgi:hypothetical protein